MTPYVASAQGWWSGWWGGPPSPHQHISADEMGLVGLALAAMIAVAGYLILRKRATNS